MIIDIIDITRFWDHHGGEASLLCEDWVPLVIQDIITGGQGHYTLRSPGLCAVHGGGH